MKEDKKFATPAVEDLIPEDEPIINPIHNFSNDLDAKFEITEDLINNLMKKRTREAQARRHQEFETILLLRSKKKKKKEINLDRRKSISNSIVSLGDAPLAHQRPNMHIDPNSNDSEIKMISAIRSTINVAKLSHFNNNANNNTNLDENEEGLEPDLTDTPALNAQHPFF